MFRRNITILQVIALLAGTGLLSSCASSRSAQVYSRDQAQQEMTVNYGTVLSVRNVQIEGTKTGVGTVAGGVAGGILGSQIGGGAGRIVGGVLGALGGAAIGAVTEEGLTKRNALEITVELDTGQVLSIVQEDDIPFSPGERVRVLRAYDGSSRVQK